MNKNLFSRIFAFVLLSYGAVVVIHMCVHKDHFQWDLYRYYTCAKAYQAGINPYDRQAVSQMAGRDVSGLTYPPVVLFVSQIFTSWNYNLVFYLYLALKCLFILGLIYFWRNKFLGRQVDVIFYLLCLFGFNSAIYLDLRAGNITVWEQCLIWLAFYHFIRRRYLVFCVFIVAVSVFKIQPLLFLCLLLVAPDKNKYKLLAGSLLAFGAVMCIQVAYDPALFSHFIKGFLACSGVERRLTNPSLSAFLRDLVDIFFKTPNQGLRSALSTLVYVVVIIPLFFIAGTLIKRFAAAEIQDKDKWIVLFACSTYAVTANYFKDYSYILLILPAYFIIKNTRISPRGLLLFVMIIFLNGYLPGTELFANLFWGYHPLWAAYLVWCLYIVEMRRFIAMAPGREKS